MEIKDGQLILTTHECRRCRGTGQQDEVIDTGCPKCNGTGDGPRGGKRKCKRCYGYGTHWQRTDNKVTCSDCDGEGHEADSYYDHIPDEMWRGLKFKVHRNPKRRQSWVEYNLGVGCWSFTDYGEHKSKTDEEIIEDVRAHGGVQACKILRSEYTGYRTEYDPTLPDYIGIFTSDMGYFPAAVHGSEIITR